MTLHTLLNVTINAILCKVRAVTIELRHRNHRNASGKGTSLPASTKIIYYVKLKLHIGRGAQTTEHQYTSVYCLATSLPCMLPDG